MAGFSNGLSAGVKNGNGKRERVDQEDDQEFMPLSKRINNIHLSPERLVNGSSASYMHTNGFSAPTIQPSICNGHNGIVAAGSSHQTNGFHGGTEVEVNDFSDSSGDGRGSFQSSSSPDHMVNYQNLQTSEISVPVGSFQSLDIVNNDFSNFQYRPSLSRTANPHYYESNRTLFELYIERQLRTNQAPHPNVFGHSTANG